MRELWQRGRGESPDRYVFDHLRRYVDRIVERGERRQRFLQRCMRGRSRGGDFKPYRLGKIEREALDGA